MVSQNTHSRRKLSPTGPRKTLRKRKTTIKYNRRDCELTTHQQSWARSLAASLSGWRSRQTFLQAQHEARLKAEAEHEAEEAARQATIRAEEDARWAEEAKAQAEAAELFAREAERHQQRALEIYEANVESPRGSTSSVGESDGSETDSTSSDRGDVETVISESQPSQLHQPTPNTSPPPAEQPTVKSDWRTKARIGIRKKKLTIDKGWSVITWNQKSNIQERLLLLEDDGFDIKDFQDRKAGSEEITAIIIERAAAQGSLLASVRVVRATVDVEQVGDSMSPSGAFESVEAFSPAISSISATSAVSGVTAELEVLASQAAPEIPTKPAQKPETATLQAIEHTTQPFGTHEPYHPQESPQLKRKRPYDIETEHPSITEAGPAFKKSKIEYPTEAELQLQALREIKQKILRRVFRPARSVCRVVGAHSHVIFAVSESNPRQEEKKTKSIRTLDYLYNKKSGSIHCADILQISKTGLDNILSELHFLTNINTTHNITITDPDFSSSDETNDASPPNITAKHFTLLQNSNITIFKDERGRQIIQGDSAVLAELFKVLREKWLLHLVGWEWDGLRLCAKSDSTWSLGPETCGVLAEIERRLRERGDGEVWEVEVRVV
ncbi:hypothetical protein N0V94_007488 [Neodidymelliopsis sp. IMI 364377]|nr:hypothetical protein N0V94_007488 [Neodidymelliopsis sp. IMI 364377]